MLRVFDEPNLVKAYVKRRKRPSTISEISITYYYNFYVKRVARVTVLHVLNRISFYRMSYARINYDRCK